MPLVDRFVKSGQNSPFTCVFMSGLEYQDSVRDRLQVATGTIKTTAPSPHQNSGYGGSAYRQVTGTSGTPDRFIAMTPLEEFIIGFAAYTSSSGSHVAAPQFYNLVENLAQLEIRFESATGVISIRRGATILASSAGSAWPNNQWNWMHVWCRIDNTTGLCNVRIGSWGNSVVSVSGVDTRNGTTTTSMDSVSMTAVGASSNIFYYDDVYVAARSMYFTAGSGSPVVGDTLTGSTSGATAIITHVFSDCFFVKSVTGTFQVAETITTSGWTGIASNALGNNEASLWIPEQFMKVEYVTADILTGFTNTTAGGGAHWSEVDDAVDTTTYISTNTASQVDEFDIAPTLPPGAEIYAFNVNAYARLNGVSAVNNIALGFDDGVVANDSIDSSILTGAWEPHDYIATHNPRTGTKFTTGEITAASLRVTSRV